MPTDPEKHVGIPGQIVIHGGLYVTHICCIWFSDVQCMIHLPICVPYVFHLPDMCHIHVLLMLYLVQPISTYTNHVLLFN